MAFCIKCGKQIPDTIKFCPYCGGAKYNPPAPQPMQQPAPQPMQQPAPQPMQKPAPQPMQKPKKEKAPKEKAPKEEGEKKGVGKKILLILLAVVLLAAVAFGVYWFFLREKPRANAYTMYLQDDQLFFVNTAEGTPILLTNHADPSLSDYENLYAVSKDGSLAYFPTNINPQVQSFTLSYRRTEQENEAAIDLQSDLIGYQLIKEGTVVIYLTTDCTLYYHNLALDRKLAENVAAFFAAEDGSAYYYLTLNNELYQLLGEEAPTLIDSEVNAIHHASEDFETLLYSKGKTLLEKKRDKDATVLSEQFVQFEAVLENGAIAYLGTNQNHSYYSFLDDQNRAADAEMAEPTDPNAADASYQQKLGRDQFRSELKNAFPAAVSTALYLNQNGTDTKLAEACNEVVAYPEQNVLLYREIDPNGVAKTEMTRHADLDAAKASVDAVLEKTALWNGYLNGRTSFLRISGISPIAMSEDGSTIYYLGSMDPQSSHPYGNLCCFSVAENYAEVAAERVCSFLPIGDTVAYAVYDNKEHLLYLDDEQLTEKETVVYPLPDGVFYLSDKICCATQNGQAKTIAEQVDAIFLPTDGYKTITY